MLSPRFALVVSLTLTFLGTVAEAAPAPKDSITLWQLGKTDQDDREFALAPDGYSRFRHDGFFVVGQSSVAKDWPYVHPGPVDAWAGGRRHTFTIVFGLKVAPVAGSCVLKVALVDTQGQNPPKLGIRVNDTTSEKSLPRGGGDESVFGDPGKGKPHALEVAVPATALRAGDNEVHLTTLSGSWLLYDSVSLETPPGLKLAPASTRTFVDEIIPVRALRREGNRLMQPLRVGIRHYGDTGEATIEAEGAEPLRFPLESGPQERDVLLPPVSRETRVAVRILAGTRELTSRQVTVGPVRKLTVYILPHSHTDIGYTAIQTAIEERQVENLLQGIEHAHRTADYPEGARFVWNVEVAWAADLYLRRLSKEQKEAFHDAIRKGQVSLNGMYLNELTGLCRPEELLRLFRFATRLSEKYRVTVDSAMISDVPGYTWGTVTAMAQAGIRYFSVAPNYFDRIGDILAQWENRPFYWVSPSGKERVLVWIPFKGYAMSHIYPYLTPQLVNMYQEQLEKSDYPFDIAHMRWSGHGDNAIPDPSICEFVKEWNADYEWPKFIISSTGEAFRAFEERYGKKLPEVRGDWTPYWEDGAASSAAETAMNRASSDRLVQAEALRALASPATYPAAEFEDAWRKVLLYSEHTWGAWCSVSDPENKMTREQWAIKQSYALEADRMSHALLKTAVERVRGGDAEAPGNLIDVYNTTSWPRTELVLVPARLSREGDRVQELEGRPVPSQRLSSGELAFLASAVPPLAGSRYRIVQGSPHVKDRATASGTTLSSGPLSVSVDETTGAITELHSDGIPGNLADLSTGHGINEYLYLPGDDLNDLERNGPVRIHIRESGPLVASLVIESDAPGCKALTRELRVTAGLDHVELLNTVDKKRAATNPKPGDWGFAQKGGKESVNFAFPFRVPGGQIRLDAPLSVVRPELDQIPSACKNWLTVGRWADVSNEKYGVTCAILDSPLVQVGGLTATLLGSQSDPNVWRKKIEPTQRIYAWVMNNHWGTNYRAYQEGPVLFRFVLRPHRGYDPAASTRFAVNYSQPLLVTAAGKRPPSSTPGLLVEPADVVVSGLKPSDDGRAIIVRLFGASGEARKAVVTWAAPGPRSVHLSDTSERPGVKVKGPVEVPGFGVVTLRAELER